MSTKKAMRKKIVDHDMMVFLTHAEGLPKTLLEDIAVGFPCVSTNINGISEILNINYLVEVENIINKIKYLINRPTVMDELSKRNIPVVLNYRKDVLNEKKKNFYEKLQNISK
jgi:glycosyltransferase involved in cell wall biosynthesis